MKLEVDNYLTLTEAARLFPGRRKPHTETVRRWINSGVQGVQLRAIHNGRWYTTSRWVREFLDQRTAARNRNSVSALSMVERAAAATQRIRAQWAEEDRVDV
tara:strand:+ start:164 stop:469 length:306 start_codon:yes stop_codon:yes gene_type:complete